MNIKRSLGFSVLLWVFIFVIWSIIIFVPGLKDKMMYQYIVYWVLMIPLVIVLTKWYYKQESISIKKALKLGVFALIVGAILDMIITIPLYIVPQIAGTYMEGLQHFYSQWEMWVGFAWLLILMAYSAWEFDRTYTKRESTKVEEKTGEDV
ncbi:hypothetical protein KJ641_00680 [Patescibacteria group bacterium]|nr:hypothetical protein [Patescibacteria group bacterium]MBU1895374.1 hypothetical protein [Patescibacteria group bacterium]